MISHQAYHKLSGGRSSGAPYVRRSGEAAPAGSSALFPHMVILIQETQWVISQAPDPRTWLCSGQKVSYDEGGSKSLRDGRYGFKQRAI